LVPIDNNKLSWSLSQAQNHDSVDPIIVEICHNSSVSDLFPRCETQAVAFLPQVLRPWAVFAAWEAELSIPCHGWATAPPQMQTPR
jgi:hypothetical protein